MNTKRDHIVAESAWLSREALLALSLIVGTGIVLYVCYLIARPFLPALAWALALAIPSSPAYDWLERKIGNKNIAAALSVLVVAAIVVGPVAFLIRQVAREAGDAIRTIRFEVMSEQWSAFVADSRILGWVLTWVDVRGTVEQAAAGLSSRIGPFLSASAWGVAQLLITFFLLYYFFRDRNVVLDSIRSLMPLSKAETDQIFVHISDTIFAAIYGTIAVSSLQGALGGLMFWWLGLPTPLLWGTAMALLGIIPIVGASCVWIPAAILLGLDGHWIRALILVLWGSLVVGLVDNFLYPILVGTRLRLHTVLVFIAVIGGLLVFGASGVILGPLTMAIAVALLDIWKRRAIGRQSGEQETAVQGLPDELPVSDVGT